MSSVSIKILNEVLTARTKGREPQYIIVDIDIYSHLQTSKYFMPGFMQVDPKRGDTMCGVPIAMVTPIANNSIIKVI